MTSFRTGQTESQSGSSSSFSTCEGLELFQTYGNRSMVSLGTAQIQSQHSRYTFRHSLYFRLHTTHSCSDPPEKLLLAKTTNLWWWNWLSRVRRNIHCSRGWRLSHHETTRVRLALVTKTFRRNTQLVRHVRWKPAITLTPFYVEIDLVTKGRLLVK